MGRLTALLIATMALSATAGGGAEPAAADAASRAATTRGSGQPFQSANAAPRRLAQASPLSANIMRRVDAARLELDKAEELVGSDPVQAPRHIENAAKEYDNINQYYGSSFDPGHPTIVGLKRRIDDLTAKADAAIQSSQAGGGARQPLAAAPAGSPAGAAARQVRARLDAAAERMQALAASGDTSDKTYAAATQALAEAESSFEELTTTYRKEIDTTGGGGFLGAKHAYNQARELFQRIEKNTSSMQASAASAEQAKYDAMARDIMGRYKGQGMTGKLHAANAGRILWSKQAISFKTQDSAKLEETFQLSDPIYGRILLQRSIANTPVYQEGWQKPEQNRDNSYEVKLFVDGQNVAVSFGVFEQGKQNDEVGHTWTTWQYGIHPVPPDKDFATESSAWSKAVRGIAAGRHAVRFEMWGTLGQYRTREPLAVGEFTLLVGQGERVAATGSFPADNYSGGDLEAVRAEMRKALVGPVAKSDAEIAKVAVTGNWVEGIYTDTKNRYRKISGAVLWADSNNDKVCRFTTYNFISDAAGGGWTPARFRSFCNGCPEGEVDCP